MGSYSIEQGSLSAGSNYELTVVPGTFEITKPVVPPVTEPPVTEPPVTEPPVTEPPVVEPPKPGDKVEFEKAKDVISVISTSSTSTEPLAVANTGAVSILLDYRLINLGIKLPDDLLSEEGATF